MKRRDFLKTVSLAGATALLPTPWAFAQSREGDLRVLSDRRNQPIERQANRRVTVRQAADTTEVAATYFVRVRI